jgi:hypothetical protein
MRWSVGPLVGAVQVTDQAKVEDDHAACGADQHVGGLEVAMKAPVAVKRVHTGGELAQGSSQTRHVGELARRGPLTHVLVEGHAIDQLHGEEGALVREHDELAETDEVLVLDPG